MRTLAPVDAGGGLRHQTGMILRRPAAIAFAASEGFLDRLACVIGAVCAAQAPEFFQQYLQRLGGHLDEARRQLAGFEQAALAAGKPLDDFATDVVANPDPGLAKLGASIQDTIERVDELTAAQHALVDASVWTRPFAFLGHLQTDIARATLQVFKPAVPTTMEGAFYAAVGVALAFSVWHFAIRLPVRRFLGPTEGRKVKSKLVSA